MRKVLVLRTVWCGWRLHATGGFTFCQASSFVYMRQRRAAQRWQLYFGFNRMKIMITWHIGIGYNHYQLEYLPSHASLSPTASMQGCKPKALCHRHVFFSCMMTSRSGRPVTGSLYLAHTPYTLQPAMSTINLWHIQQEATGA